MTYFVTSLGTQRFYCESYWWVLVLPLALYRIVRVEAEQRVREMAPEAIAASQTPRDKVADEGFHPGWGYGF